LSSLLSDIRRRVWYIEARAGGDGDYASADAASMGSGVLVEIEHRDEPRKVRRYLLTCAHVVRRKLAGSGDWGGPVYDEILCWRPGQGYTRTYADKRRIGEHPDIYRATLSALSPCGGRPDVLPDELRDGPHDWVLLEFEDAAFQKEGRPLRWSDIEDGEEVRIVGYPGGAGLTRHAAGTRTWVNGSIVENLACGPFSQQRTPEPGMLSLSGVDETRPGMSGGGIFDRNGALVGLHRAADDMAMQRNAIAITHIRDALDTRRNAWPTTPTREPLVSNRARAAIAVVLVLAVGAAGVWELTRPRDCLLTLSVRSTAAGKTARVVDVTRAGGVTDSQLVTPDGSASLDLSRMASREHWSFSLRYDDSASKRVEMTGCPASPGAYELEEAHVRLAPQ
jgi:hypothetical protein